MEDLSPRPHCLSSQPLFPGGRTYKHDTISDGEDYCDLGELIDSGLSPQSLFDLDGEVTDNGEWNWNGSGDPRDHLGNSITNLQVFNGTP